MKIKSYTELLCTLKYKNVDILEFDWVEGKTKDSYVANHPTIQIGRRFWNNPFFWTFILDFKLNDIIEYILEMKEFKPDDVIIRSIMFSTHKKSEDLIIKMADQYFKTLEDDEAKQRVLDTILLTAAESERFKIFKFFVEFAKIGKGIEPLYNNFGNAGNGMALYYATKQEDSAFVIYLLDLGADPTLNDSISFALACKLGHYETAVLLATNGADIHTKHDLGLKMVERNDKLKIKIPKRHEKYKKPLIQLYKTDEDKKEE